MKNFLIILAFFPLSLFSQQSVLSSFNGYGDIVNVIDVDPTDSLFTIEINNFYGSPRFQPFGPWIAQDVQVGMVMWVDCARFVITNVNSASFSTMNIDVKVPSVDWNLGVATPLPNSRCAVVFEDQYLLTALPAPADGNSGALSGINNTLFACMLNHYSQALLVTKNSVNEITDYVAGLDTIPSEAPGPNIGETWRNSVGQLFYSDGTQWLTDKEVKFSNASLEGLPSYLYKLGIDTLGQDTLYISNNGIFRRFQSGLVYKEGYGINIFATDSIEVDTNQIATQNDLTPFISGTGANGQVTFWTGLKTQSGSNNLFWDNSLNRLSVSQAISNPAGPNYLQTITSSNTNVAAIEDVSLQINYNSTTVGGTGGAGKIGLRIDGTGNFNRNVGTYVAGLYIPKYTGTTYSPRGSTVSAKFDDRVIVGGTGFGTISTIVSRPALLQIEGIGTTDQDTPSAIAFSTDGTTGAQGGMLGYQGTSRLSAVWFRRSNINGAGEIAFATNSTNGGNLEDRGIVNRLGQWGIGTTTVASNTALTVRGTTALSTDWTAQFHNSSTNNALMIRNDGFIGIGTATQSSGIVNFEAATRGRFHGGVEFGSTGVARISNTGDYFKTATGSSGFGFYNNSSLNATVGDYFWAEINSGINPTSGSANFSILKVSPTLNITGTAAPTVIGIDYNPTLTSVLGNHYAAVFRSGRVGIGTAAPAQTLHVAGTMRLTGNAGTATEALGRDASGDISGVPFSTIVTSGGGLTGNGVVNYLSQYNSTSTLDTTGIIWVGGRMGIGATAPAGRLHVVGQGGSTNIATFVSNAGNTIFQVRDDNYVGYRNLNSSFPTWFTSLTSPRVGLQIDQTLNTYGVNVTGVNFYTAMSNTAGISRFYELGGLFNPTSGTATYKGFEITTTINQTGGANGDIIGFDYNPSFSNRNGRNFAALFRSGNVGIGTATPNANLRIQGYAATASTFGLIVTNSDTTTANATLVVRDDKRVGIGTNAPTDQLHTTGSVRLQNYPNTLNSTGNPVNVLSTSSTGVVESHAASDLLANTGGCAMPVNASFGGISSGAIEITLPNLVTGYAWISFEVDVLTTTTTIQSQKFKINIYCDLAEGGTPTIFNQSTVYVVGGRPRYTSNVRLGRAGNNIKVWIDELNTNWNSLVVKVHDVSFEKVTSGTQVNPASICSGWSISLEPTSFDVVQVTRPITYQPSRLSAKVENAGNLDFLIDEKQWLGGSYLGTFTGAIQISLPDSTLVPSASTDIKMHFSIYFTASSVANIRRVDVLTFYNYVTRSWGSSHVTTTDGAWNNLTFRFGREGTVPVIYIGELNSSFTGFGIALRGLMTFDIQDAQHDALVQYPWSASTETAAFSNVNSTRTITATSSGAIPFTTTLGYKFNDNLLWDNTNARLGVGNTTPLARLQVSGSSALSTDRAVLVTDNATTPLNLFEIRNNGDIYFNDYPNTLNTTGNPVNVLSTGTDGLLQSHPISEVISSAGGVTGSGVDTRVAYWNGTSSLTNDANFRFLGSATGGNSGLLVGAIQFNGFGESVSTTGAGFAAAGTNRTLRMQGGNNNDASDVAGIIINSGTINNRNVSTAFEGVRFLSDVQGASSTLTSFTMLKNIPRIRFGVTTYTGYDYDPTFDVAPTNHYAAIFRSGRVGIGLSAPTANLHVRSTGTTSSTTALLVQNGAATPANLLSVLDNGNVGVGTAAPAVALDVFGQVKIGGNFTLTDNNAFSVFGNQTARQITNNSGTSITNSVGFFSGTIDLMGSQAFTNSNGIIFAINNRNTNSANNIAAGNFTLTNDATNAGLTNGYAIVGRVLNNSNLAITNVRNFHSDVLNPAATNVITNLYLYNAEVATNNGTITSTYGFHVGDITKGTQTNTPFSFYASDPNALNYFAGNTGIGVTAPTRTLDINGETRIRDLTTTTATGLVGADADGVLSNVTFASAVSQGGGLTGNGVTNYLAQYNSSNTLDTTGIIWTGGRMGIGTATPSSRLEAQAISDAALVGSTNLASGFASTVVGSWTYDTLNVRWNHVVGNTNTLTATVSNISSATQIYRATVTIVNRTAGSIRLSLKGSSWPVALTGTSTIYFEQVNTANNLVVTPTSDFNGSVSIVINSISALPATTSLKNTSGTVVYEERATTSSYNVIQGVNAGMFSVSGNGRIFIGRSAGKNSVTSGNIAIGTEAGMSNYIGGGWAAIGSQAGTSNISGINWYAIGAGAGQTNISGNNWFAIGTNAARFNRTGSNFVAIGERAAYVDTTANAFVAIGNSAAFNHLAGSAFVAIGAEAAAYYTGAGFTSATDFSNGVYIGYQARVGANGAANETVIGYQALGLGTNTTRIGNTSTVQTHLDGRLTIGNTFYDSRVAARIVGADASTSNYSLVVTDSDGATSTTVDPNFVVRNDGLVGIGTYSPTAKLQINGSGNTNTTTALTVQNSDGANLLRLRNDGAIIVGIRTSEEPYIAAFSATTPFGSAQRTLGFVYGGVGGTRPNPAFYFTASANLTHTAADGDFIAFGYTFNPTSGNGVMNTLNIQPTINQTGGANGNTRGLFIAPTLTNALNWRSIEWSNNTGYGLYGAGTAPNLLNGILSLPLGNYNSAALQINSDAGTGLYSAGAANVNLKTSGGSRISLENASANYLRYSEDITNAVWNKVRSTITSNAIMAPDSTLTADLVANNGTAGLTRINQNPTVPLGTDFTFSIFVKQNNNSSNITFGLYNSGQTVGGLVNINPNTFTIVSSTYLAGSTAINPAFIENHGNGWYRIVISVRFPSAITGISCFLDISQVSGEGVYVWGAQAEAGGVGSSYIETVASAVGRPQAVSVLGSNVYGTLLTRTLGAPSFQDLSFTTQNATRMTITNGGSVGIGATSPARLLHVQGEARISDLTTDTPTRIVGADADGDLGEITLGSGLSITSGVLNTSSTLNTGSGTAGQVTFWNGTNSITGDADMTFDGTMLTASQGRIGNTRFYNSSYNKNTTGALIINTGRLWDNEIDNFLHYEFNYFAITSNANFQMAGIIRISANIFSSTNAFVHANVFGDAYFESSTISIAKNASGNLCFIIGTTTSSFPTNGLRIYLSKINSLYVNDYSGISYSVSTDLSTFTNIVNCSDVFKTKQIPWKLNRSETSNTFNNVLQLGNLSGATDAEVGMLFSTNTGVGSISPTDESNTGSWSISAKRNGSNSSTPFLLFRQAGTVRAGFTSTGSLGLAVNPSSVNARLHVVGAGTTTGYGLIVTDVNNNTATASLVVQDNGRVGIGTNAPATKLDVIGDVEFQNPTTSYDGGVLGTELLTTGTGSGWTGTSFATGYKHDSLTTALTSTFTPNTSTYYQLVVTVTGRTAGTATVTFGGYTAAIINSNTSINFGPRPISATALVITPTADFNGTVTASLKAISPGSPQFVGKNNSGTIVYEERLSSINTNVMQGVEAGQYNTTGNNNMFQGYRAGRFNTTGYNNIFQGTSAGQSNTVGYSNIFQGANAGQSNTTGYSNIFQGFLSGFSNTSGYYNLFQGGGTGYSNTTGYSNIFQGFLAGYFNTTGSNNIFQGGSAGYVNSTGSNNIFQGANAGYANTSGSNNLFQGSSAGVSNTTGTSNLFQGQNAGRLNTTGSFNIFTGENAGYANRIGSYNIITGYNAGRYVSYGTNIVNPRIANSILIGYDARAQDSVQTNQIVIGYEGRGLGNNTTRLGNSSTVQTHLDGRLTVGNTLYDANTTARIVGLNNTSSTYALVVTNSTAGTNTTSEPALVVTNTQNVGIGTYSPGGKLEISGENASNKLRLTSTSNLGTTNWSGVTSHDIEFNYTDGSSPGVFSAIRIIGNSLSGLPDGGTVRSDFTIWTGGYQIALAERLRITAQGNVGIGNSAPAKTLHVTGEVRISDLDNGVATRIVGATVDGDLDELTLGSGLSITSGTISVTNPISASEVFIESSTATTIDLDANTGVVKDVNGTNASFTLPTDLSRLNVYKNGIRLARTGTATTRDFSVNTGTNEITFTTALLSTDRIVIVKI